MEYDFGDLSHTAVNVREKFLFEYPSHQMATTSTPAQTVNPSVASPNSPSADRDLSFTEKLFVSYGYMIVGTMEILNDLTGLGIFSSWFLGVLGFPYIFTVIVIFVVYKVHEKTRDPLIKETLKQINLQKLQHQNQVCILFVFKF